MKIAHGIREPRRAGRSGRGVTKVVIGGSLACIAFCSVAADVNTALADAPSQDVVYTVQDEDTMWLIAAMFYDAPTAYAGVYDANRKTLEDSYDKAVKNNPKFDKVKRPKGPSTIFTGVTLRLPDHIFAKGIRYERRIAPMNRGLATKVATEEGIDLTDLIKVTGDMKPAWSKRPDTPSEPLKGFSDIKPTAVEASRETVPSWYKKPDGILQMCAKAVCDHHRQLCFFECLGIAKRFVDGGVSCRSLNGRLPLEVDVDNRNCSEMTE